MIRALAVGFGLAMSIATFMFACGGDDTSTGGGAGTTSTGAAGSSGAGTGGTAAGTGGQTGTGGATGTGGGVGVGGGFSFDGGFDFDAFAGKYTCADLSMCCPKLPMAGQAACTQVVMLGDNASCSAALSVYKLAMQCL
jgi:hypothetical protein